MMKQAVEVPSASGRPGRPRDGWPMMIVLAIVLTGFFAAPVSAAPSFNEDRTCSRSAGWAWKACKFDYKDDFRGAVARCLNSADDEEYEECLAEAKAEVKEHRTECREVRAARRELCRVLGEETYAPDFDPANFLTGDQLLAAADPNPWWPLVPGNTWTYEGDGETIVVEVLDEIEVVDGVECIAVRDTVTVDEEGTVYDAEVTEDWYTQDLDGNVWYCGEISLSYEVFEGNDGATLADIEGSWRAGEENAHPGIVMFANPQVDMVYRQEFLIGEAEDVAEVVSLEGDETVPAADCNAACLVTLEYSPLEPGVEENKYYKWDVGLVLEVDAEDPDARVELVGFVPGP